MIRSLFARLGPLARATRGSGIARRPRAQANSSRGGVTWTSNVGDSSSGPVWGRQLCCRYPFSVARRSRSHQPRAHEHRTRKEEDRERTPCLGDRQLRTVVGGWSRQIPRSSGGSAATGYPTSTRLYPNVDQGGRVGELHHCGVSPRAGLRRRQETERCPVDATHLIGVTNPPGPPLINDADRPSLSRARSEPAPPGAAGSRRSRAVPRKGLYLVICGVLPHFNDGMYGWVRVV